MCPLLNFAVSICLSQTYKPERQLPAGSKASALHQTMQATMKATLGGGELQNTVKLPPGEDLNEWIAVNTGEARALKQQ